ncbi:AtzG-like protein [Sphingobium sp. CAP-1]|uniref:AtzG-like protein n=1 Tax=Sphingobium sp. CAP-1 TaxID=2676077 RepID=UPI0012BB2D0D|nr:AtzG-like protein [Sphingobium sp. CAP-1]QGP79201.1 DUF4089 domain-containing protein [Sphingobium sp. CAP-1]
MARPTPSLPHSPDEIAAAADAAGIAIPDACMAGVIANLALLARHAAILRDRAEGDEA